MFAAASIANMDMGPEQRLKKASHCESQIVTRDCIAMKGVVMGRLIHGQTSCPSE